MGLSDRQLADLRYYAEKHDQAGQDMKVNPAVILELTDTPSKRGGRRNEAAAANGKQVGRPRKDNVILHCHVPKATLDAIDKHRGTLSRGDYIASLVPPAPDQS